jgi:hypothetical protein
VCDGGYVCEIPCTTFGDEAQCPPGLACGVTVGGLRCVTTRAAIDAGAPGNGDDVIDPGELYSACETFAEASCLPLPTGSGTVHRSAVDCFCSASCLADDECPAAPPGYGRPICLVDKFFPNDPGTCALTCDPGAADPPCPANLHCRAPVPGVTYPEVATCRGGIYRHGNGDDVIDPGEAYGPDLQPNGVCDIGLAWTSEDGGRCIGECERDDDCPAPPPGYRAPVCDNDGVCWLSCDNPGSTSECLPGLTCGDVNVWTSQPLPPPVVLGCE